MFQPGFFGTRAPLFMDMVTLIVALLPLLVAGAIHMARLKRYGVHAALNTVIFLTTLIVIGYFEYGVRLAGGYSSLSQGSEVPDRYLIAVLAFHIIVAVTTLAMWANMLYNASKHYENGLPGPHSRRHKRAGIRTFIGIVLTSLTGIWIYLLLFVF